MESYSDIFSDTTNNESDNAATFNILKSILIIIKYKIIRGSNRLSYGVKHIRLTP